MCRSCESVGNIKCDCPRDLITVHQLKSEIMPLLEEAIGDLKLSHVENAAYWLEKILDKLSAV